MATNTIQGKENFMQDMQIAGTADINFDKIDSDINNILGDVTKLLRGNSNVNIPVVGQANPDDFKSACKIFGVGCDK